MPPALSPLEKQIGQRLRAFRELLLIPVAKFAAKIGISGDRLLSYERGRSRLRWEIYRRIATEFPQLNPYWLAKGEDEPFDGGNLSLLAEPFDDSEPFSTVFAKYEERRKNAPREAAEWEGYDISTYEDSIAQILAQLAKIPDGKRLRLFQRIEFKTALLELGRVVRAEQDRLFGMKAPWRGGDHSIWYTVPEKDENSSFKTSPDRERSERMPTEIPDLDSLLSQVREAVSGRGLKTQLAADLKIPIARLSEWLSLKKNTRRPDAENTLRLLAWVRNPKRKK